MPQKNVYVYILQAFLSDIFKYFTSRLAKHKESSKVFYIQILTDLSMLFSTVAQKARNTVIPWMLRVKLSLILPHFGEAELIYFFLNTDILLYLRQWCQKVKYTSFLHRSRVLEELFL